MKSRLLGENKCAVFTTWFRGFRDDNFFRFSQFAHQRREYLCWKDPITKTIRTIFIYFVAMHNEGTRRRPTSRYWRHYLQVHFCSFNFSAFLKWLMVIFSTNKSKFGAANCCSIYFVFAHYDSCARFCIMVYIA